MYSHPDTLKKIELLKHSGIDFKVTSGAHLARGFADLGYEEFILLPNNNILSLFSGDQKEFSSHDSKNFFLVPTTDQLIEKIIENDILINAIVKTERGFKVELFRVDKVAFSEANNLFDAFLNAFLDILGIQEKDKKRSLKVEK